MPSAAATTLPRHRAAAVTRTNDNLPPARGARVIAATIVGVVAAACATTPSAGTRDTLLHYHVGVLIFVRSPVQK